MDRARAYLYWRVFGVPVAAFLAVVFLAASIFQHVYLMPAVAERETLKSLVSAIFELVVLSTLPVTLWLISRRHRALIGQRLSRVIRIGFGVLGGVCLVFVAGGIFVMVTILCRLAGVPV